MIKADIAVYNGTILTMDNNNTIFEEGLIAVSGNSISYIGKNERS